MRRFKRINNKRFGIYVLIFILIITTGGIIRYKHIKKINNQKQYKTVDNVNVIQYQYLKNQYIEEDMKPNYNIALDQEYQDLIYQLCKNNNISYEFTLSIMYHESSFNPNAINNNKNGSKDISLFQLNDRFVITHKENAIKYCELPENIIFDINNPNHNIRAGIGNIVYLRDYYKNKGVSEDELLKYCSNAYQLGIFGYANHVKKTGMTSRNYSKQVSKYKEILENTHTMNKI
jgi:hypothetical protein